MIRTLLSQSLQSTSYKCVEIRYFDSTFMSQRRKNRLIDEGNVTQEHFEESVTVKMEERT